MPAGLHPGDKPVAAAKALSHWTLARRLLPLRLRCANPRRPSQDNSPMPKSPPRRLALVLPLALAVLAGPNAQAAQVVRFAPLPLEQRKIVQEQFQGLADYLEEAAGVEIEWVHLNGYEEILAAFCAGKVDLAYLGPLPYLILSRDCPQARPLGCFRDAEGAAAYTCSLVVFGDSGLTLGGLKGVRFGLTQPYSTCGYLASSEMLASVGLTLGGDGNRFSYAGSHSEAALGVARGQYDVAGIKTSIAARYRHLNLDVIATSAPYPGFNLVANAATLAPGTLDRLQQAVLRLDPAAHPEPSERMQTWGDPIRHGTVPAEQCDYSGVAAALGRLPWPIPAGGP
jgi:phosphonate transport system substrate-binding protein